MLLKDKVVIVSGIGPGLGQELAYGAAREGAKIAIAARSTELLNKLKEEIGEKETELLKNIIYIKFHLSVSSLYIEYIE